MKQVKRFIATDCTEHTTERKCRQHEALQAGKAHECPACHGTGTQRGDEIIGDVLNPDYGAFGGGYGDNKYRQGVVGYEHDQCVVCRGVGWTEREKEPIVATNIVGWKDNPK
jgi:DnaJ-class molecular chaperone